MKKTNPVLAQIDFLNAEIKKLEAIESPSWKTNQIITTEKGDINIGNVKEVKKLYAIGAYILRVEFFWNKSCEGIFNLKEYPVAPIGNYTSEDYKQDLNTQMMILTYQDKLNDLKKDLKEAQKYVKEADREQMFLASMAEKYNNQKLLK